MLKILYLIMDERKAHLEELYGSIQSHCECDLRRLSSDEQSDLKKYFKSVDLSRYDYVMLMLRHKKMMKQARFLKKIPQLVFFEHDAWMNYNKQSGYYKKFSKLYKKVSQARIISTGFQTCEKLKAEGFKATFVAKGYDSQILANQRQERRIELGFVGSIRSSTYKERVKFLNQLTGSVGLQALQTQTAQQYVDTLNQIQCFISADIHFNEYMSKNFEAMACGCVLVAFDQGDAENQALGFKDMENVVLYRDMEECLNKIALLRNQPELARQIAEKGQKLAEQSYRLADLGKAIVSSLQTQ